MENTSQFNLEPHMSTVGPALVWERDWQSHSSLFGDQYWSEKYSKILPIVPEQKRHFAEKTKL